MHIKRAVSNDEDFIRLTRMLDADLESRYGSLQKQYDRFNKPDHINDVIVLYKDEAPVACGAFKEFNHETAELKRIFVDPACRGLGLGKIVVNELEKLAASRGYRFAVLETGIKQHEAISLYKKLCYAVIPNYGPYIGNENSVCMKKKLGSALPGTSGKGVVD